MKLIIIFGILTAVFFVLTILWIFLGSNKWEKVQGMVLKSNIREEYTSPSAAAANNEGLFRYHVDLTYQYTYIGKQYKGTAIYPSMPNIFTKESLARDTAKRYPVGKLLNVFIDPQSPSKAALITSNSISVKGKVAIMLSIMMGIAFVVGGVYLFLLN